MCYVKIPAMNLDRKIGKSQIPVPPNERKPSGCPDHGAISTQDCTGPLNNSVCQEFCPKGLKLGQRTMHERREVATETRIIFGI